VSDPTSVRQRRGVEQYHDDLRVVMKTAAGRRVVHALLHESGVFRRSMAPGDSHLTAFHEGQRAIGLAVHDDVREACFDLFMDMLREARADAQQDALS